MLRVWFLNVGHGDCTVIEHPSGRLTMIDINNSQDYDPATRAELSAELGGGILGAILLEQAEAEELDCPVTFFKDTFGSRPLFRFVLTHPDLDHMRGIKALFEQVEVTNFWDTANTKPAPQFRSQSDREDWDFYQRLRSGKVPGVGVKRYKQGEKFWAFNLDEDGTDGGDGLYILSPTQRLIEECNRRGISNDLSLALCAHYAGVNVILPGDAETLAWDSMLDIYGDSLKSEVLKASHHGRDSGFHLDALKAIDPKYVVVSVGRKPNTDAQKKYAYHCANVYSTRYYGRLMLEIDPAGDCQWTAARNGK